MKTAKTIYLARHGATNYNDKDLIQGWMDNPLSQRGIEESEKLAERLKDEKLEIIYHSTLCRTKGTAEIVNRYHQVPLQVIESFIEMNLGDWEGKEFLKVVREHPEIYQEWASNPDASIPGGETFKQVYDRVKPGVQEVLASPYKRILIVAHAMVNRAIMGNMLGIEPLMARRFRMDNCALSRILAYDLPRGPHFVVDIWNESRFLR
jgi:probable phosphoglycerate mutase